MDAQAAVVGIRFGTANVCVAVPKPGLSLPDVVADEGGDRQIASCVVFNGPDVMIGLEAINLSLRVPKHAVRQVKAALGRKPEDEAAQIYSKEFEQYATIVSNPEGLSFDIDGTVRTAEDIATVLFKKLKVTAESAVGGPVGRAVLSIPESFGEDQRDALTRAALAAGLRVERFVHDPVAVALAYAAEQGALAAGGAIGSGVAPSAALVEKIPKVRHVLVFHAGAKHTTATLLEDNGGVFAVIGAVSEEVGGDSFDHLLTQHFAREFETKSNIKLGGHPRAMRRLRQQVEVAKCNLSRNPNATVQVDALAEGVDFTSLLTRARFETLCAALLERSVAPVHHVLESCEMKEADIDQVLLSGGTSRIIKLQQLVAAAAAREPEKTALDFDAMAAIGCAVQASLLKKAHESAATGATLSAAVAPNAIGVEGADGKLVVVIPKYRTLPIRTVVRCARPGAATASVNVYEGDDETASNNKLVARLPVPASVKGPLRVVFELDVEGRMQISVAAASAPTQTVASLHVLPALEESAAAADDE